MKFVYALVSFTELAVTNSILARQLFVNNSYSEFYTNLMNGLGVNIGSRARPTDGRSLHEVVFLCKERLGKLPNFSWYYLVLLEVCDAHYCARVCTVLVCHVHGRSG